MTFPSSTSAAPAGSGRRNRGWVYTDTVDGAAAGWTVLDFYVRRYPHSDETAWAQRIRDGAIRHDGQPLSAGDRLRAGQQLAYHRPPWNEPPAPRDFGLLWDDGDVLAVDKPAGLQVLPAAQFLQNTLLDVVRERHAGAPAPVHRLGRGTSGIVLFARSAAARRGLSEAFARGRVRKRYRALAQGVAMEDRFTVDAPIGRLPDPQLGWVHAAVPGGKPARSQVTVVERRRRDGATLVEVEIPTGRPHQIRIHLAAAGWPLVGEPLYDVGGRPRPPAPGCRPLPGDTGYHLHAMRVDCTHPVTHAAVGLYSRPPDALGSSR